jgi:thiol-disulfide isomerase/thioredoxin
MRLGSHRSSAVTAVGLAKHAVFVLGMASLSAAQTLVPEVRGLLADQDFRDATAQIETYRAARGETPESVLALSWMARAALSQKQYASAEAFAQEAYQRSMSELKKRPLDQEPNLPLALGTAIEVQAQAMAAQGARTEAVQYLTEQLQKYARSSIHSRIQKNINILSLQGKPAPVLTGVSIPAGKPALLFFWAHWCGDCRAEAPLLAGLKKEFGPQALNFIGPTQKYGYFADVENAPPKAEVQYIEQIRKQYYSAVMEAPAIVNEDNFRNYGVSTTPTLVLVDRKGIVRLYHPGGMTYGELRSAVESVLKY